MFLPAGYVCLFLCTAVWVSSRIKRRVAAKGFPLPPGPAGLPLIGNLLDFPSIHPWLQFTKWRKYGDVVYLNVAGQGILVLNTIDDVNALLRDKPNIYSDRPSFTMIGDLMGLAQSMAMLPYGKELKEQRKLVHLALSQTAVAKYHVVQEDATAMYLQSIIDAPKTFMNETRLISGRIILTVTYGIPVRTPDDLYITEAEKTMEMVSKYTVPGAHVVDIIPWLRHLPVWLPWNTIHETGKYGRDLIWSTISRPYERVKLEYSEGKAVPSFVKDCLENLGVTPTSNALQPGQDHSLRWAAGSMYGAGGETTYTSVLNFIIAMALYPDQQNKLREELEKATGVDRLPKVSDRANLPFFNATIKEILRWRPALPLSIARQARYDDFYNGYFIPKGTIVLPNVWAISVDDKSGIPTHDFAPERFLQAPAKTPTDPYSYAFGFGRRECPGKALGDNNLFCLCAGLIFAFEISVAQGGGGRSPKDVSYTSGLVSYPEAFDVAFVCRYPERVSIIKERVESIYS